MLLTPLIYLIHAGIGEQERGVVVRNNRTRLPEGVVMLVREERDERVPDARCRPTVVGELY